MLKALAPLLIEAEASRQLIFRAAIVRCRRLHSISADIISRDISAAIPLLSAFAITPLITILLMPLSPPFHYAMPSLSSMSRQ
jgi:hypothetical protein